MAGVTEATWTLPVMNKDWFGLQEPGRILPWPLLFSPKTMVWCSMSKLPAKPSIRIPAIRNSFNPRHAFVRVSRML